jgi:glutaredoxin
MESIIIKLFGTSNCHLCEKAEAVLNIVIKSKVLSQQDIHYHKVDIMEGEELYESYGLRIPVVQLNINENVISELNWPFNKDTLSIFLINHITKDNNKKAS